MHVRIVVHGPLIKYPNKQQCVYFSSSYRYIMYVRKGCQSQKIDLQNFDLGWTRKSRMTTGKSAGETLFVSN